MTTLIEPTVAALSPTESLAHYRRTVSDLYRQVRDATSTPEERHLYFRQTRDDLFANHPQSPLTLDQKQRFNGLGYFDYDPSWRYVLPVDTNVEHAVMAIDVGEDGVTRIERFGKVSFERDGQPVSLSLFWILGYGGGIFLPFRDLTNSQSTYGGGRYLLDTIKHADLGYERDKIVLDFNFAYNPSCSYNSAYVCPLSPPENRLPIAIGAGEKRYEDAV